MVSLGMNNRLLVKDYYTT